MLCRFLKSSHEERPPKDYQVRRALERIAQGGELSGWDEAALKQPCRICGKDWDYRGQCGQATGNEIIELYTGHWRYEGVAINSDDVF